MKDLEAAGCSVIIVVMAMLVWWFLLGGKSDMDAQRSCIENYCNGREWVRIERGESYGCVNDDGLIELIRSCDNE